MNDRELLELAAKAAGYEVRWHERWECFVHIHPQNIDNPPTIAGQRHVWVPLADDGDALRLAVRLRITPRIHLQGYSNAVTAQSIVDSYTEMCGDDEMAATRRAIVRAAAAIAQQEQPQ